MNWMIVVPVVLAAGVAGGLLNAFRDSENDYGPLFYGSACGVFALALSWLASVALAGVALPTAFIVVLVVLTVIPALAILIGSVAGDGGGMAWLVLMFLVIPAAILGTNRVADVSPESAALPSDLAARVLEVNCGENEIVVLGRERENGFEVEGYRYRIASNDRAGSASLSISLPRNRYSSVGVSESGLLANGEWQSRRASESGVFARDAQAFLDLTIRIPGQSERECSLPVSL